MSAQDCQDLIKRGQQLFGKRTALMSFWQEIAENFYPERADFTTPTTLGRDFMSGLTTSYPSLVRRDLGNAFGAMLRPTSKDWFHIKSNNYDDLGTEAKSWMERAESLQRRMMYKREAQFLRATKEGDHDYAAFGQCVTSVELNSTNTGLLYRTWPLRDVVWCENEDGIIDTVFRRWKLPCNLACKLFANVHSNITTQARQDPYAEVEFWHVIAPSEMYQDGKFRFPFVSVYLDPSNVTVMESVGARYNKYNIPRWQTLSGSQYAYSPATVVALPDARLLQSMSRVLLDAGEKAVNPPLVSTKEAIRGDVNVYAGGITWVSAEYDERLGEVLRPMTQAPGGIPLGLEMQQDTRQMLMEAFYLNKLTLPPAGDPMTAYETGQRVQEYIRQSLPLFEPTEQEINGGLCDKTFSLLLANNAFGPLDSIPKELLGSEVMFEFESPLHDAIDRAKGQRFIETRDMIAAAMQLDQGAASMIDAKEALRDVLSGIGAPAKWMRSESEVLEIEKQVALSQQQAAQLQAAKGAADVVKTLGVQ